MDLRIQEIYVNLKNFDFDILGNYKMDKSEAQKLIDYVEDIKGAENENNRLIGT